MEIKNFSRRTKPLDLREREETEEEENQDTKVEDNFYRETSLLGGLSAE